MPETATTQALFSTAFPPYSLCMIPQRGQGYKTLPEQSSAGMNSLPAMVKKSKSMFTNPVRDGRLQTNPLFRKMLYAEEG
jgi:hypothetical protein